PPSPTLLITLSLHDALPIFAAFIAVVLHEHQVPQLDVAAAVAREFAISVALFACAGTEIVMNLRARTAWASLAHGPEVVLLVEADRKSTRLNSSHVSISYAV